MSSSSNNLLKSYLKPSLFIVSILVIIALLLPFVLIIDQFVEVLIFQGTIDIPNPINVVLGEANIFGRIFVTILFSVVGTALASYFLIKLTDT